MNTLDKPTIYRQKWGFQESYFGYAIDSARHPQSIFEPKASVIL